MTTDVKTGRVMTAEEVAALNVDAKNRATRTAYVQLLIDVGVAVAMFIATTFASASGWDEFNWKVLGFSLVKTVVATIGAFVMRRYLDPSAVPTPLPPSPQVPPSDPLPPEITPEPEADIPPAEPVLFQEDPPTGEYDGEYPDELDDVEDGEAGAPNGLPPDDPEGQAIPPLEQKEGE